MQFSNNHILTDFRTVDRCNTQQVRFCLRYFSLNLIISKYNVSYYIYCKIYRPTTTRSCLITTELRKRKLMECRMLRYEVENLVLIQSWNQNLTKYCGVSVCNYRNFCKIQVNIFNPLQWSIYEILKIESWADVLNDLSRHKSNDTEYLQ